MCDDLQVEEAKQARAVSLQNKRFSFEDLGIPLLDLATMKESLKRATLDVSLLRQPRLKTETEKFEKLASMEGRVTFVKKLF